ncbi:MAG: hypothetical protein B6I25_02745 [Planctomycetales bacterium 4572_13]|nr:MAG: hypothetical protein B6I25_02745 [Planctomycetales bacterium 4572_13]
MSSEKTYTCALTARGMAAISSVALAGPGALGILDTVFQSGTNTAKRSLTVPPGEILHGSIVDDHRVIDEVVVGCEGTDVFIIHCHGNPLLVEQIILLLQSHGAELIDANRFALAGYQQTTKNAIEAEARLAMQKSATLSGVKILQAQINGGLSQWAQNTLDTIESLDTEEIKRQCREILQQGLIAQRIIEGVKIIIAGPPNSGKSTLLNCLAGQQQVIVSDTAGTTRDWVSATGYLDSSTLRAEFIDTAGLDDALADADSIEHIAQERTQALLESCDLILFVQDITEVRSRESGIRSPSDTPIIEVHNKYDLLNARDSGLTSLTISAKNNEGIDLLVQKIIEQLGIADFNMANPAVFTQRQRDLLLAIINSNQPPKKRLFKLLCSKDGQ